MLTNVKQVFSFLCLLAVFHLPLAAQTLTTTQKENALKKADSFLKMELKHTLHRTNTISRTSPKQLQLIVEASNEQVKTKVQELGGKINTDLGKYFTVALPKDKVFNLLALKNINRVYKGGSYHRDNFQAKRHIKADKVHTGLGLNNAYKGKGVVVGIIDDGIDYTHADFRDPADPSKSRIAYIWNQADEDGTSPANFSYGSMWSKEAIEADLLEAEPSIKGEVISPLFGVGHGTHVSGSAAGNRGIAPEATIIVVSTDLGSGAVLIDAVNFINEKALELGLPCVINTSWGTSIHPGDGFDPISFLYDQLLSENVRLGICAAAGNTGPGGTFWEGDLDRDTMYTGKIGLGSAAADFYVANGSLDSLYLTIYVDSVSIDPSNPLGVYVFEKTIDSIESTLFSDFLQAGVIERAIVQSNGDTACFISIFSQDISQQVPGYPNTEFFIGIDDRVNWLNIAEEYTNMNFFRFEVSGSGQFYAKFDGLPGNLEAPAFRNYPEKHFVPTKNSNNVGSPAVARNILAVGAYTNQTSMRDIAGNTVSAFDQEGAIAIFSSAGPSQDGRLKPEITAPGELVSSSLSRNYLSNLGILDNIYGASPLGGDPDDPDLIFSGTSMAAPMVTGSVALIWQANPELSFAEIKELIITSATSDVFTGDTPNTLWGHGKINTLAAVEEAEKLFTPTGLVDLKERNIQLYPNPITTQLQIDLTNTSTTLSGLSITDIQGKEVGQLKVSNLSENISYPMGHLLPGAYFLHLQTDEGLLSTKIIKQ